MKLNIKSGQLHEIFDVSDQRTASLAQTIGVAISHWQEKKAGIGEAIKATISSCISPEEQCLAMLLLGMLVGQNIAATAAEKKASNVLDKVAGIRSTIKRGMNASDGGMLN